MSALADRFRGHRDTSRHEDTSANTLEQKILNNRPALAVDRCVNANGTARPDSDCDAAFVVRTNVRVAAGEVATSDVMKCQVKPMSMADYPGVTFTGTQWAALSAVFPGGVCDYSKPGIGQVQPTPWLTFEGGPVANHWARRRSRFHNSQDDNALIRRPRLSQ